MMRGFFWYIAYGIIEIESRCYTQSKLLEAHMSLTFEQFMAASKRWDEMEKRLVKLFGFNPATSNHYGTIQLYNQRINESTTDEEIMNLFPKSDTELVAWCEKVREKSAPFSMEFNSTKIQSLLNANGILHYNRKYVPSEYIKNHTSDSNGAYVELLLPNEMATWIAENGTITATTASLLDKTVCNNCGGDYKKCDCIKYVDRDVTDTPSIKALGLFWTDKMA